MALVQCPECGKEISDSAVSCPHCGYPLSNINEPPKASPIGASPVSVAAFILSIIGVVAFFVGGILPMAVFVILSIVMSLVDITFVKGNRIFTLFSLVVDILMVVFLMFVISKLGL